MQSLAEEAIEFSIEYVDHLFGPEHTTKAHWLATHPLAALFGNRILWEGETSENEGLHGSFKKLYTRTNKRGLSMGLQMMRAAEAKTEVFRELCDLQDVSGDGLLDLFAGVLEHDGPTAPIPVPLRSHRGQRATLADMQQIPVLATLGEVLGKAAD